MTLYDDILDLLDLVGRRDCLYADWGDTLAPASCDADNCEPCRARVLTGRLVEARDRVEP